MANLNHIQRTHSRALRRSDTEAEHRLWQDLRGRRLGGHKFVRQLPVGPFIADFACREHKLIVEVDGATHASEDELTYDERRTSFLVEQGWRVLRIWNHDVFTNRDGVCETILIALAGKK